MDCGRSLSLIHSLINTKLGTLYQRTVSLACWLFFDSENPLLTPSMFPPNSQVPKFSSISPSFHQCFEAPETEPVVDTECPNWGIGKSQRKYRK